MPELPEVETVKKVLNLWCTNQKIAKVHVYYPSVLENSDENTLNQSICGCTITNVGRRGKFLVFELENYVLLSHLRMEGKWHYGYFKGNTNLNGIEFDPINKNQHKDFKHVHFVIELENHQILMYHDVRKFGRIGFYKKDNYEMFSSLAKLGKEPFDISLNANDLFEQFKLTNIGLKQMLLSQSYIAGVGNIYADEIAFRMNLLPTTPVNTLTLEQCEKLIIETAKVLQKAIDLGGSTIKSYHAANNVDGKFQNELLAYGRSGEKCFNCGNTLYKTFLKGRGTTYCPSCQKSNIKNRIIGVTGAIGSGKTKTCSLFEKYGYKVLDADKIVRENQEIDKPLYNKMITLFKGINILNEDATLNRGLIRNIIINDTNMKAKLEKLVHPFVKDYIYNELLMNPLKKYVLDVPLLFESKMDVICDKLVFIDIAANVQNQRLIGRNTMPVKDAKQLENSILDNEIKKNKCDFIVSNNGSLEELERQVDDLINQIK